MKIVKVGYRPAWLGMWELGRMVEEEGRTAFLVGDMVGMCQILVCCSLARPEECLFGSGKVPLEREC